MLEGDRVGQEAPAGCGRARVCGFTEVITIQMSGKAIASTTRPGRQVDEDGADEAARLHALTSRARRVW